MAAEAPAATEAKRTRTGGTMPEDLKARIEQSLDEIGEVEFRKRSHRKGSGPVRARCLAPEDLVHEKGSVTRQGNRNRLHYECSNPKCTELIRNDKWDTHVLTMTSDRHLQEDPGDVLERSMNFAADRAGLQKRCSARGSRTRVAQMAHSPIIPSPAPPCRGRAVGHEGGPGAADRHVHGAAPLPDPGAPCTR